MDYSYAPHLTVIAAADYSFFARNTHCKQHTLWSQRVFLNKEVNHEHRHSGIGMMTPAMVHYGLPASVRDNRQLALAAACAAHPERFVCRAPAQPQLHKEVWINKPPRSDEELQLRFRLPGHAPKHSPIRPAPEQHGNVALRIELRDHMSVNSSTTQR
jgi:hypothetical protein